MKLRMAAPIVLVLLVVIYASIGIVIYFTDIARDWCGSDPFDWYASVWYALLWPARLFAGAFCD